MPRKSEQQAGGDLFAARTAFAVTIDGEQIIIQPGQVVDANDPVFKGREQLFEPFAPKVRHYPGRVEQATAAPGEKRT